jgi:hypothetical protein
MAIAVPEVFARPPFYQVLHRNDESLKAPRYAEPLGELLKKSSFLQNKLRFVSAKLELGTAGTALGLGEADAPNDVARGSALALLDVLENEQVAPGRVTTTMDGGIAVAFVSHGRRAVIETYNTGEMVAATYSDSGETVVWEIAPVVDSMKEVIEKIRVHLAG